MRKMILYAVLALSIGLMQVSAAMAVTIGFSPGGPYTVTNGSVLNVGVVVSDLAGQAVSAYDLDILYNPAFLSAPTVTFSGAGLSSFNPDGFTDVVFSTGLLDVAAVSLLTDAGLLTLQGGSSLTLFTIGFSVIQDGETTLAFDWGPGQDVKGLNNEVIVGGAPVPEPGTFLLLGGGLAALVAFRRRQHKKMILP